MLTICDHASIAEIGPAAWASCFPEEVEGYDYYLAVEEAGLPGFTLRYLAVREDGRVIAAAPAFLTDYRLDATVQGGWKRLTNGLSRVLPSLLSVRLACIGSPVAERCHMGLSPEVPADHMPRLLEMLLRGLESMAWREGIGLIALKDVAEADAGSWDRVLAPAYRRLPGLPTATLALPYASLDGYLAALGRSTRKHMRRRLRSGWVVTVERRTNIDDVLTEVQALYEETMSRSDLQFERLPPRYFTNVLRRMSGRAACVLYRVDGRLAAFNLVFEDENVLVDKFFGMRADLAKPLGLYFLSWMENVRQCIERSIPVYHSGQACYGPKLRLGSELSPNWLYFKHRNRFMNAVLGLVSRLVSPDNFDPAVKSAAIQAEDGE